MGAEEQMRGKLIAVEGVEASGKSTQAERLARHLGALLTREPGGTALGERLRELLLDPRVGMTERAEALLIAADRAQHVAEVVMPALSAGRDVVSDRWIPSSLAYQGFGRGLPVEQVREISLWATDGLDADLVVLLDAPVEFAAARRRPGSDRFEREGREFHEAVRQGYLALAESDPESWVVVDASGTVEEVWVRVRTAVEERLAR
ncbi:MAG: thymidylate kinase [Acidimicrobiales bacterium]|nr:MAG: thymidylate kinase [Acidimicrobiales bacterium]